MPPTVAPLCALAAWLGPVLLTPLILRRPAGASRRAALLALMAVSLASPLFLRGLAWPLIVTLVAINSAVFCLRLIEAASRSPLPGYGRLVLFLSIWPGLNLDGVLLPLDRPRGPLILDRLARSAAYLVAGGALVAVGQTIGWRERSYWVGNAAILLTIYALGSAANHLMVATSAALGLQVRDAFRYPVLARSVLDFWARYDVWIHAWLKRHVFRRIGRRRPDAAILATFAASGLAHEYLIVIAQPWLAGRQFAFFFLHGLAGVSGAGLGRLWIRRTGRSAPTLLGMAASWGVMFVTGPLFVDCLVALVVPPLN